MQSLHLERIQMKRKEMISLGEKYGLCADETISCSWELDQLLNEYYNKFQLDNRIENYTPRKLSLLLIPSQKRLSTAQ